MSYLEEYIGSISSNGESENSFTERSDTSKDFNQAMDEPAKPAMDEPAKVKVLSKIYGFGLIFYGILENILHWLWVNDMLKVEKGLVFGPPDDGLVDALIVFTCFGTLVFLFEIADFVHMMRKDKPIIDKRFSQVILLYVDELPSIIVSFILARCREIPVSYFQLAKAVITILGAVSILCRFLWHCLRISNHKWEFKLMWILRTFIILTCIVNVIMATLVLVFTYTPPPGEGSGFQVPDTVIGKSYDNGRYFYKSGVYLSHPVFHHCATQRYPQLQWNESRVNWLKLDAIYPILDDDNTRTAIFYYNEEETYIQSQNDLGDVECYRTNLTTHSSDIRGDTCYTEQVTSSGPCNILQPNNFNRIDFVFRSADKTRALVYGDIKFNASVTHRESGSCDYLTIDEWGFVKNSTHSIIAQLQYLQADQTINDTQLAAPYFLNATSGALRPYRYQEYAGEMRNVADVWLTGYKKCEMTGALAPNPDHNLQPTCGDAG